MFIRVNAGLVLRCVNTFDVVIENVFLLNNPGGVGFVCWMGLHSSRVKH